MPKKKKQWRSIQLDLPDVAAPAIPEKDLFYVDTRGTGKKKRKKPSNSEKASTLPTKQVTKSESKKSNKRVKIKKRLKATDIWKEEKEVVTPKDVVSTTEPAAEGKSAKKGKKSQKSRASKRAPGSRLTVPERFELIGSRLPVADPGISINPDPKAQKELIQRAYELHVKEKNEHDALMANFRSKTPITESNEGEEEAKSDDGKDEEPDIEGERPLSTRVISERRLTQAQRNKKLRKHALSEELKKKKAQKSLKAQIHMLPKVLKNLQEEEVLRVAEKAKLEELKKHPDKPLRLGKNLIESEFPEVLLTDEVQGGHFRNVQPSAKVVSDQFKRFQERNLIEPRKKNKYKRRYKLKEFDRYKASKEV